MTARRHRPALALLAAGSIALAACGTDPGAGGPEQAVQERLDRGVAVEVTLEADPAALDDPEARERVQELLDRQADGPLLVASRSGDGAARGVVLHGGAVEARLVDDTAYLRLDTTALAQGEALGGGRLGELLEESSGDGDGDGTAGLATLFDALGEDRWIGVSGLDEERLAELAGVSPDPGDGDPGDRDPDESGTDESGTDDAAADVEELLAERGLDDLSGLFEGYATVTGEGPWQVEVHARDLATALAAVGDQVAAQAGDDADDRDAGDHQHDPEDLPERVGGVVVSATDGVADRVTIDLARVLGDLHAGDRDGADRGDHQAMLDGLAAADARLVLDLVDVGDRVDTPTDAAVVDGALLEALLAGRDGAGPGFPLPQD